MPRRISVNSLNASTMDILNVIRRNAPLEYQNDVPVIDDPVNIPQVGAVIYGHPAHANYFIGALINRIALVRVQSATFNNPYVRLKKGYLEFGETVEEIFVNIAKVMSFDPEKASARELKRYLPEVDAAFHIMNWRVTYPITISDDDLKQAFLSIEGVQDLIARIVDSIYTAAEYDEYLLFKYLLIKAVASGKMHPVSVGAATTGTLGSAAVQFRGISNVLPFMASTYNEAGVMNTTPKSRQIIFMDAMFNAQFDVEVLASAFNMDKADFMGSLYLIDNWTTFDNQRWTTLKQESTWVEDVTAAELAVMTNVKAIMVDEEWFQVYDNNTKFTEKFVASGDYWNYFYHTWKTFSRSPYANAVVFVTQSATITLPTTFTVTVNTKLQSAEAYTLTVEYDDTTASLVPQQLKFVQTQALTEAGIAVQEYGAFIIPIDQASESINMVAEVNGTTYYGQTAISSATAVGTKVTFSTTAPTPTPPTET